MRIVRWSPCTARRLFTSMASTMGHTSSTAQHTVSQSASGQPATFGAGCYWGTEKYYRANFQSLFPSSITSAAVGFMGPPEAVSNPSYEAVCRGDTGHVEVVHLQFDPSKASYEDVVRFFYTFHDPTTLNKQGNDRGTQYASAIFYHNDEQRQVAERVTKELQSKLDQKTLKFSGRPFTESKVSTAILPATTFFPAETYHQRYLEKNPDGYCNHSIRFKWTDQSSL